MKGRSLPGYGARLLQVREVTSNIHYISGDAKRYACEVLTDPSVLAVLVPVDYPPVGSTTLIYWP